MSIILNDAVDTPLNPLDVVEELVLANDWDFHRTEDDEISIEVGGRWGTYRLLFIWQEDAGALHFCCRAEASATKETRAAVGDLLMRMNERLWIGHFDLCGAENALVFRHTSLLRGMSLVGSELIEDMVEISVGECDRFFPAFQLVANCGKTVDEAIEASILEPIGEA